MRFGLVAGIFFLLSCQSTLQNSRCPSSLFSCNESGVLEPSKFTSLSENAAAALRAIVASSAEVMDTATVERLKTIDLNLKKQPLSAFAKPEFSDTLRRPRYSSQVLRNWESVERLVHNYIKEKKVYSKAEVEAMNDMLTQNIWTGGEDTGKYREKTELTLGATHIFRVKDVTAGMSILLQSINSAETHGEHPIRIAAMAWQGVLTIHPFIDANGRTAVALANWILIKHGYPSLKFSSVNEVSAAMDINKRTPTHLDAIKIITNNIFNQMTAQSSDPQ